VAWFLGQSLPVIGSAFLLGLLVGWLWWGRQWKTADTAEAVAVTPAPAEPEVVIEAAAEPEVVIEAAPPAAATPAPAVVLAEPAETVAESAPAQSVEEFVETEVVEEPADEPAEVETVPIVTAATASSADAAVVEAAVVEAVVVEEIAPSPPVVEPVLVAEADFVGTEAVVDDLERIEGIGPVMASALHLSGIRTYRRLAETDEVALRAAIEAAGQRFAPSLVTWARQARLLADGDEEAFAELTRRLVAGRDVGRA